MRYIFSAVLIASVLLYSCSKKEEKVEHPITFVIKTFKLTSEGGCASDSVPCASFTVNYPEFTGLDTAVAGLIAHKLDSLITEGYTEGSAQTIQQTASEFIRQHADFVETDSTTQHWYFSATAGLNMVSDSLLSIVVFRDEYMGGAHPNSRTDFINVNPATGKKITLDDELKEGYRDALNTVGEKVFRTVRELPDTASLQNNYFEFPNDKFALNNNYGFTKHGILFFFNSYEVAPYATGPTEVLIPYDKIKDWIK
jgi:hypothetical protein